jgi:sucrose-6-phosphate hydrolase SacC (GH32 family)
MHLPAIPLFPASGINCTLRSNDVVLAFRMRDRCGNSRRLVAVAAFLMTLVVRAAAEEPLPLDWIRVLETREDCLLVPVANRPWDQRRQESLIGIYDGSVLRQTFTVVFPEGDEPFWWAPYSLEAFAFLEEGLTLKVEDPGAYGRSVGKGLARVRTGSPPDAVLVGLDEPYRNQFHFSALRGWNNDPNGLVWHDGRYHLYYQFNPFGTGWGNMHWGHATSHNLIDWQHQPVALHQRTVDDMAYSGGGFVDVNNAAGFGAGTLFVAFTSTGRGECIAYSRDGGFSFVELEENPVLRHLGRDPKIFWYGPEKKWVMIVYSQEPNAMTAAIAPLEGKIQHKRRHGSMAFYASTDLRTWERTGTFTHADRLALHECPELFELPIIGRPGESRWILFGGENRFFVGQFDGKTFIRESGPQGERIEPFYAAQTFSNEPSGRRIQIGWIRTERYLERFPEQRTSQAMSLPQELTLHDTAAGLRVFRTPADETVALRKRVLGRGTGLSPAMATELLQTARHSLTEIVIQFEEAGSHPLRINGMDASFEGASARIFTDRTFNECFIDHGQSYKVNLLSAEQFEKRETSVEQEAGLIAELIIYELRSIWNASMPRADAGIAD